MRTWVLVLIVCALGVACSRKPAATEAPPEPEKKAAPAPAPKPAPPPKPSTETPNPAAPEELARVVARGGRNWSAADERQFGGSRYVSGDGLWLWPVEDKPVEAKAGHGTTFALRWRLRPGKAPREKADQIPQLFLVYSEKKSDGVFGIQSQSAGDIPVGKTEGTFECHLKPRDPLGGDKVLVFVEVPGVGRSNLLELKAVGAEK